MASPPLTSIISPQTPANSVAAYTESSESSSNRRYAKNLESVVGSSNYFATGLKWISKIFSEAALSSAFKSCMLSFVWDDSGLSC